jgi:hypothetical protein
VVRGGVVVAPVLALLNAEVGAQGAGLRVQAIEYP